MMGIIYTMCTVVAYIQIVSSMIPVDENVTQTWSSIEGNVVHQTTESSPVHSSQSPDPEQRSHYVGLQVSSSSNTSTDSWSTTEHAELLTTQNEDSKNSAKDLPTTNTFNLFTENSKLISTVSKELLKDVTDVLSVFSMVFEAVSFVLMTLSAYIYSLPNMRCPTAKYLVALNTAGSISAAIITVYRVWRNADSGAVFSASYLYFSMFGALFVAVACNRLVYCFNLLLSAERFFVVTFPLKARYMRMVKNPVLVIAILVLVVQVYHVYLPLKYQVKTLPGGTRHKLTFSDAYQDNPHVFNVVANVAKIVFSYMPLILCLGLGVALVIALKRHAVSRKHLQETRSEAQSAGVHNAERQLATTILVSTLLFVLLSLPSNTVQIIASYHPYFRYQGLEHNFYSLVNQFASLTLVAARYTNFLAYLGLSTSFRRNLLRLLCFEKVARKTTTVSSTAEQGQRAGSGARGPSLATTVGSGMCQTGMTSVVSGGV